MQGAAEALSAEGVARGLVTVAGAVVETAAICVGADTGPAARTTSGVATEETTAMARKVAVRVIMTKLLPRVAPTCVD